MKRPAKNSQRAQPFPDDQDLWLPQQSTKPSHPTRSKTRRPKAATTAPQRPACPCSSIICPVTYPWLACPRPEDLNRLTDQEHKHLTKEAGKIWKADWRSRGRDQENDKYKTPAKAVGFLGQQGTEARDFALFTSIKKEREPSK